MAIHDKRALGSTNMVESVELRTLFPAVSGQDTVTTITEDHVVSLIMLRRGREAIFGKDLFSDPAWDILLELYAIKLASRSIALSDLALAIGTPYSRTIRWVSALEAWGFVERNHPAGGQQSQIQLTTDGAFRMKRLVHQWGSAFVAI